MTEERLLRIKQVLELVPVSKSTWWKGVQTGQFPKPLKLTPRTTVWRWSEIQKMISEKEQTHQLGRSSFVG